MIQLLILIDNDWDTAKGYLREDLDHIQVAINAIEQSAASLGDLPAGTLVGRGSGIGPFQTITLGAGLLMTGTVLSATGGGGSSLTIAQVAARVALHV